MDVQHPDVTVRLTGQDGNAFNLIGLVKRGLQKAGKNEAAQQFTNDAFQAGSYDELLQLCMKTVNVE